MKINPQLTAGFTIALINFSTSLIERAQTIELIKMSELQFIISKFKEFFLLLIVNKYDHLQDFDSIIVNLENVFLEKFGTVTEEGINQISVFFPFESMVKELCKTIINVAVIAHEFEGKTEIWQQLIQMGSVYDKTKFNDISLVQIDNTSEIPNCTMRIWKVDAEQNNESFYQAIENKNIVVILIQPTLNYLRKIIPKLALIRQRNKLIMIYGISLKNYGRILKSNIEVMLDLKIIEINSYAIESKNQVHRFLNECTMGLL